MYILQGAFSYHDEASLLCMFQRVIILPQEPCLLDYLTFFSMEIIGKYSKSTCSKVRADPGLAFLLVVQFTVVHRGEKGAWITGSRRPGQQENNS